jgi:hypothetical protein
MIMAYRNYNTQTRVTIDQPFYWDIRPYGNPHPARCHDASDFYYETITWSSDSLTKTVETVWKDKDAFLSVLPPDVFEQPKFQEWHDAHEITFTVEEDEEFQHEESRIGDNRQIQL